MLKMANYLVLNETSRILFETAQIDSKLQTQKLPSPLPPDTTAAPPLTLCPFPPPPTTIWFWKKGLFLFLWQNCKMYTIQSKTMRDKTHWIDIDFRFVIQNLIIYITYFFSLTIYSLWFYENSDMPTIYNLYIFNRGFFLLYENWNFGNLDSQL